jgi:hypothetical protein
MNFLHFFRVPLHKGKSLRSALRERGLLDSFLRRYQYTFSEKYSDSGKVASERLTNYLDVSGSAGIPWKEFSNPLAPKAFLLSGILEPVGCGAVFLPSVAPQCARGPSKGNAPTFRAPRSPLEGSGLR